MVKLNNTTASLNFSNVTAGVNQVNAFINQSAAFLKTDKLTVNQAHSLIDAANEAIASALA